VHNPRTGRLERLDLSNALLGPDRPQHPEVGIQRPEYAAINVDLIGQARGRCLACSACGGYERQAQHAANENDVEVLRCARCGCQNDAHEQL